MRKAFLVAVAALALSVAGCGSTIKPEGAAQAVTDLVSKQTGFTPTDTTCPDGIKAEIGAEFDCKFTGPDGNYVAHVRVVKVDGEDLDFYIQSQLEG